MGKRRAMDDVDCDCAALKDCSLLILLVLSVYLVACAYWPDPPARYSVVALGAVSGLDPATDLQDGRVFDPAFNLTVRVDATGRKKDRACLDESTFVHVSYLGVPLAVGRAIGGACAEAGGRRDVEVVARGRGVAVPGYLVDSLAEDMRRRGVARFEVALVSPRKGGLDVMACWGEVGDAATLEAPCQYSSWVKAGGLPVPQQLGGSSGGGAGQRSRKVVENVASTVDDQVAGGL
jgi:hypothetical protein